MTKSELKLECVKLAVDLISSSKFSGFRLTPPAKEVKSIANDLYECIVSDTCFSDKQPEQDEGFRSECLKLAVPLHEKMHGYGEELSRYNKNIPNYVTSVQKTLHPRSPKTVIPVHFLS